MNRRHFHCLATGILAIGRTVAGETKRPRAPFRLLYSNDTTNVGGVVSPYHKAREPFLPEMLEASVDETAGKGVDAHFLQPGLGMVPMWPSKVLPLAEHYQWIKERYNQEPDVYGKYVLGGGDVVKVFLDRCREKGLAGFISLRMNDAHHKEFADTPQGQKPGGNLAMSVTRWYAEHPEWRIKAGSKRGADVVLNWAVPEVRARPLALIGELCAQYDLDGLELDFMRFPSLFRAEETTAAQRVAIMAGFVQEVRAILDRTARAGKHRWLCLRIPCLLKGLDALGLDPAALTEAGADMLNVSASYFTAQTTDLAEIRRQAPAAAVYLEMCHSTWNGEKLQAGYDVFPFRRTTREQFQTTAHLAYARGADGVSLFNFAYFREHGSPRRGLFGEPPFDVLPSLTKPASLAKLPQHWFLAPGWDNPYVRPPILPREVSARKTATFQMDMAPPSGGWTKDARLRLQFSQPLAGAALRVRLNGQELAATEDISETFATPFSTMLGEPNQLRAWIVPAAHLYDGVNALEVTLLGGGKVKITFIDLAVK